MNYSERIVTENINVDKSQFESQLEEQRKLARSNWSGSGDQETEKICDMIEEKDKARKEKEEDRMHESRQACKPIFSETRFEKSTNSVPSGPRPSSP